VIFRKKHKEINEEKLQQLIQNLRDGSAEAFHILYDNYSQKVYRFCLRMLGDAESASDAFQETFIKVYEHRKDFRGDNFASWLFTIARNCCLNIIRAKKEHFSYDEIKDYNVPLEEMDIGMQAYIKKAVSKLPVALREALILREYQDCSYQEIADIAGIDLSLAKVRVHRARLILRKLLEPLVKELYES
jgi:RNA polymerase sigma-70 factor, ECF subfamily